MQSQADEFNVVTVRSFRAADHGKELIDAMFSFGVKSILRCDKITLDKWFSDSKKYVNTLLSEVIIASHMSIWLWKI